MLLMKAMKVEEHLEQQFVVTEEHLNWSLKKYRQLFIIDIIIHNSELLLMMECTNMTDLHPAIIGLNYDRVKISIIWNFQIRKIIQKLT